MNPVSSKLIPVRYIADLSWQLIFLIAAVVLGYFFGWGWYVAAAVCAIGFGFLLWLIPAQVKHMGWLETDDELLITRGKIWHTFTVVPYGRIQFVDVSSGPLTRMFGLKTVKLHTASASTDASISGLLAEDADALRERLAEQARERMSGL